MRINRSTSLLLSAAVAVAVAAPAAANRPQDANDQTNSTQRFYDCEDDVYTTDPGEVEGQDHVEFFGDDVMWPPNHKTQDMEVVARASDDDEAVTLYTQSTHDEFFTNEEGEQEELNGSGNTDNDAQDAAGSQDAAVEANGEARTTVTLRSERSGRGDGRTYEIDSYATFDGEDCTDGSSAEHHPEGEADDDDAVNFFVEVPHDMRSDNAPEPKSPSLNEDGSPKGGNGGGNS